MKNRIILLVVLLLAFLVLGCENVLHNRGVIAPVLDSTEFDGIQVYVPVILGYTHVWWWDGVGITPDSNNASGWPGDEMEISEEAEEYYLLELIGAESVNIIFNNGGNGEQTSDLEVSEKGVYWVNGDGEIIAVE